MARNTSVDQLTEDPGQAEDRLAALQGENPGHRDLAPYAADAAGVTHWDRRPPIAILGVPFDNVTAAEALRIIERMVASGRPHYLATANVDFLVQARVDLEPNAGQH